MELNKNEKNIELINAGDFDGLLNANYRYIKKIALNFNTPTYQKDLEQVGVIGFWNAYNNFDQTKGVPFIGFASNYIRNEMLCFLTDSSRIIKLGKTAQKAIREYSKLENPTEEELAKFSKKQLEFINSATFKAPKSLDELVFEDNTPLSETIKAIEEPEEDDRLIPLIKAVELLSKEHKTILKKYYGIGYKKPYKLSQLAKTYNCKINCMRMKIKKAESVLHKKYKSQIKKA